MIWMCLFSGCGFRIAATHPDAQIKEGKFRLYRPGASGLSAKILSDPNCRDPNCRHMEISWPGQAIEPNEPVWIPYRPLEFAFGAWPMLNGKLENGKSVILMVDSGCGLPMLIGDSVIRRHGIPVLPIEDKEGGWGVCDIRALHVGGLTFTYPPCFFISQHLQLHGLGLPLWKQDTFLLGLPALQRFRYVTFDNPNRRVRFSKEESFVPAEPALWEQYPITIDREPNRTGIRLSLVLPLAGEPVRVGFDSGGGYWVMKETPFEALRSRLTIDSEKKGTFLAYQHGALKCRQAQVRDVSMGGRILKRTKLFILPDDTPYLPKHEEGYLSLREFRDTVVVLDFEKLLFWVQTGNSGG
jgi:hypothetical protein